MDVSLWSVLETQTSEQGSPYMYWGSSELKQQSSTQEAQAGSLAQNKQLVIRDSGHERVGAWRPRRRAVIAIDARFPNVSGQPKHHGDPPEA